MKISVICCAYNEEDNIRPCLESLLNQKGVTNADYEIIAVNDDSKDKTADLCKSIVNSRKGQLPLIRYLHINRGGLSIARNTGLVCSSAPLVAYIDADAIAHETWIAEILKAWNTIHDADVIGGKIEIRNSDRDIARFLHVVYYDPYDQHAIIGANMSFRKQRLLEIGAFCEQFVCRGDETFLLLKMGSRRKEAKWPAARIFHDRPDSIRQWLKERISSGEMSQMISRMANSNDRQCFSLLFKRAVGIAIITAMALLFSAQYLLLIPVAFAIKAARNGTVRRLQVSYSLGTALLLALPWELLSELGIWLFCIGRRRGTRIPLEQDYLRHRSIAQATIIEEIRTV